MSTELTQDYDDESLNARFIGTCVELKLEDLEAYDSVEKMMDHRGMRRYFTRPEFNSLSKMFGYSISPKTGVTMRQDWHIRFGRGLYKGNNVICIHHSAIHHFFLIPKDNRYAVYAQKI